MVPWALERHSMRGVPFLFPNETRSGLVAGATVAWMGPPGEQTSVGSASQSSWDSCHCSTIIRSKGFRGVWDRVTTHLVRPRPLEKRRFFNCSFRLNHKAFQNIAGNFDC
jgi:hypothetical protein